MKKCFFHICFPNAPSRCILKYGWIGSFHSDPEYVNQPQSGAHPISWQYSIIVLKAFKNQMNFLILTVDDCC